MEKSLQGKGLDFQKVSSLKESFGINAPKKTPSIFQEHYNLLRECLIEVDNHCILQIDRDLL